MLQYLNINLKKKNLIMMGINKMVNEILIQFEKKKSIFYLYPSFSIFLMDEKCICWSYHGN